ncbi:MAG: hypothetical protein HQL49_13130 [Gammaproteobacteria bacterium]|nr:hypothetical protein [Gammaproteobacteria bacterium]
MMRLRESLIEDGIIFCYSGYMTEEVLFSIGDVLKKRMTLGNVEKKIAKSIFHVFVEQFQNVIRYSAETEGDELQLLRYGLLTVGQHDDKDYFIACSNRIEQRDVPRLRDNLESIQRMSEDEMRQHYKNTLRGEIPEGSKGAGVGFIDIARHSKRFDFDFVDDAEFSSYFSLTAFV